MLIKTFLSDYTNQITQTSFICKPICYYKFTKKTRYNFNNLFLKKGKENNLRRNFLQILMEMKEEIWLIKWPVLNEVFKQIIAVLIILSISAFFVYTIDGILGVVNRLFFIKLN
ncbi:preprotein translocase secE subunit (nucleomorph) [Cryptomonas paramecium]|uniref:Preprotein translocase secE subunit n=1 Tax=Cryptomonas paramaecium TaxID=2898 RepID=F2HI00_9CRYP|nr:preprotein translocase secE subunit [Cryptomonas paramecium]AEA38946.1 preprotein translocase secE subunit [Cryptomonas paramecium]|mmetsp:Transcript_52419/g.137251  ORF Transcript_52419/g.137251 Transcript_52419/m.137251 type:complete len:114 (-) Transcript_52419:2040-2381(-)